MNLLLSFKQFIEQENLFHSKDKLLLAVSGGIDSVVLCALCKEAGYDFVIAHCNFQLRGPESGRDEEFVKDLGNKYATEVLVKKFETEKYAQTNKLSIQVAARELRYQWFAELTGNTPSPAAGKITAVPGYKDVVPTAKWVVTAHHRDDNIETMLMNFFKGTGITGLRGILPAQGRVRRPLLFARKEELLAFAHENGLSWVEDSSNASDNYSRNYVRHQVIPLVEKIYPGAVNNLAGNLPRFREIELLYQQAVEFHKKKLVEQKGNEYHIPVLKLKKTEPLTSVLYEIVKDFGFHAQQVNEIIDLLDSETGKYMASSSHRIIRNRNWLVIAPLAAEAAETILIEADTASVKFGAGGLQFVRGSVKDCHLPAPDSIALVDFNQLKYPLILRRWKQGDYFYPLGMKKKKKLARFFIDQKLSKTDKEKVWVLETNKKIAWVIGYRIDDRFKIVDKTETVLTITSSLSNGGKASRH